MNSVIRVSLPTYDALTDTNPDHFALYSDQDWVLIKEYARGSGSSNSGSSFVVNYSFSYVPFVLGYYQSGSSWILINGEIFNSTAYQIITNSFVEFYNTSGSSMNFKYFIFYDQIA